jgi:hypothetical protein
MAQETWLVVAVGAGFLLLGIAVSPLGWVALLHRRSRADRENDRRLEELGEQFQGLRTRVDRSESTVRALRAEVVASDLLPPNVPQRSGPTGPIGRRAAGRPVVPAVDGVDEPKLIKVPKLSTVQDRQSMHNGLSQRYAAIWELAESGSTPDAIARATGQPIGQIELILGLRRQVDATRTNIPHASHE